MKYQNRLTSDKCVRFVQELAEVVLGEMKSYHRTAESLFGCEATLPCKCLDLFLCVGLRKNGMIKGCVMQNVCFLSFVSYNI